MDLYVSIPLGLLKGPLMRDRAPATCVRVKPVLHRCFVHMNETTASLHEAGRRWTDQSRLSGLSLSRKTGLNQPEGLARSRLYIHSARIEQARIVRYFERRMGSV